MPLTNDETKRQSATALRDDESAPTLHCRHPYVYYIYKPDKRKRASSATQEDTPWRQRGAPVISGASDDRLYKKDRMTKRDEGGRKMARPPFFWQRDGFSRTGSRRRVCAPCAIGGGGPSLGAEGQPHGTRLLRVLRRGGLQHAQALRAEPGRGRGAARELAALCSGVAAS